MAPDSPPAVDLTGRTYLDAATALLLAARGDDPLTGLWEAGDIQWWWKDQESLSSFRATFWLGERDEPIAALLLAESPSQPETPCQVDADLLWRPRFLAEVRSRIQPTWIARLAALANAGERSVGVTISAAEPDLARGL